MNYKDTDEIVTLLDENSNEHKFEVLDIIENKDGTFYALLPQSKTQSFLEENYYIFELKTDKEDHILTEVTDPKLLDSLEITFELRFNDMYNFDDK